MRGAKSAADCQLGVGVRLRLQHAECGTRFRYECKDGATGKFSKAVFDLLHRKYPDNDWAKKTPHWFN